MANFFVQQHIDDLLTSNTLTDAQSILGIPGESLSGNWERTYTFVKSSSAGWNNSTSLVQSNSSIWNQNTGTINSILISNSASWDGSTSLVQSNSSIWNLNNGVINSIVISNSGNWNNTHAYVASTSANSPQTVTNFLSTNNVILSSVTILNKLRATTTQNSAGVNLGFIRSNQGNVNNVLSGDIYIAGTNLWFCGQDGLNNVFHSGSPAIHINTSVQGPPAVEITKRGVGGCLTINNYMSSGAPRHSLRVNDTLNDTTPFIVDDIGYVGIGTALPTESLTVAGNISSTNIIYDRLGNSGNWNSAFATVSTLSASWEESADILPTVTNYLSTNNVLLSSATILDTLSARSYVNNPTGKTIYVDASVGNDTRNGFSKYDSFKPYRTLSAAIADSSVATGDLVYVRAGTYAISSQINLNLKGNLYFENGTVVNIASEIVAFSYSQNSVPITIRGYADFILAAGATGVLTMPSGNDTTVVNFECSSIVNLTNNSTGSLFNCAVGVLGIDSRLIQAVAATVFNITGTGKVTSRIPYVYCGVFLNGAGAANPGGGTGAQINTDIWTLIAYNSTAGMNLNLITTNFRMVNYNHYGVGIAYNWTENTTTEAHGFQGITWNSNLGQPNITFNSSAGSTTSKLIRLDQTNVMRYASTNSLSSNVPINVATYGTFASVSATPNITFKVGSFTVDADVNAY